MRRALLLTAAIFIGFSTCSVLRQEKKQNESEILDRELQEAMKSIQETKDIIKGSSKPSDDAIPFFNSLLEHIPFLGQQKKSTSTPVPQKNDTTSTILQKTREEMRRDVELLREYYTDIRMEFDDWLISNKHQQFKSMLIGASSAIAVLFVYWILVKCCLRRTRGHLAGFANQQASDNQWLLGDEEK
ncbi:unnamed protein product [Caenorhabditis angaria]|uniref:Uncharacterized protein n=1 Tax=Caenorhabditis angaria TaxID=860376 RepID=A0A9P1N3A8_9PELO|nr:unnamed protein product [Caenorhabditis angaria]